MFISPEILAEQQVHLVRSKQWKTWVTIKWKKRRRSSGGVTEVTKNAESKLRRPIWLDKGHETKLGNKVEYIEFMGHIQPPCLSLFPDFNVTKMH